ncbi:hypothetical protein HY967_01875 [Candidatus Jorgensenbacteria bacterium]|nr:hypothetical protein [Candidatus Jorgensenbacteria bacterium]
MKGKSFILATGLLAGTIIGAGIFSLPYVFNQIGLIPSLVYMSIFTAVYSVIHIMYGDLSEKFEGEHQFFYLAKTYLSKLTARVATFAVLGELLLVLVVYLILAPTFFEIAFGVGGKTALLIFWILGSVFMFVRLSWLGITEIAGTVAILFIIGLVLIAAVDKPFPSTTVNLGNMPLSAFFLPFGPLLFSLSGRPAVSKMVEEHRLSGKNFSLRKAIVWGTVIPAIVYTLFVIGIIKLNPQVSPEALDSLGYLPPTIFSLLGIMGLVTLWTSYFMIGINVKDILRFDMKVSKTVAGLVVVGIPLFLYSLGFQDFLSAVSFTGSVFLALEGLFIVTMWRKAFPENSWRWVVWPLYLIFFAAITYEIINIFS